MSTFNFPSLAEPEKIGFRFDSMYYSGRAAQVDDCCLSFDTYGDGMCQHSREWPIATSRAADYFASLAAYLLEHPELADEAAYKFRFGAGAKAIEFAASVVYREPKEGEREKPRYYSLEERKVTTADKRNDRRYERVESWMDGKSDAIIRLLYQSYYSALQMFALRHEVRDWVNANEGHGWSEMPVLGDPESVERGVAQDQHTAWYLLQSVISHLDGLRVARGRVANWKERIEYNRTHATETAA